MKFTFTEKKMESSEDLRAYSIRKIGKLDRFFKTEADAYVTFSIERGRFRQEGVCDSRQGSCSSRDGCRC